MRSKEIPPSLDRYVEAKQRLDGAQGKQKTRCGSMRIIHRSNSSFFSFLFRFYEPINRNEAHRARSKMYLFYLAIDIVVPEPIVENHRLKISAWKIGERASVESEALRKPASVSRDIVGRSIVPLARRPSYRGRKATRNFVIHVSFILKKFLFLFSPPPFFSLQTKAGVVPSFPLFLNSNQRSKSFRKEKKTCSLFTSIESFPLRIPSPLSCVTSIAKK